MAAAEMKTSAINENRQNAHNDPATDLPETLSTPDGPILSSSPSRTDTKPFTPDKRDGKKDHIGDHGVPNVTQTVNSESTKVGGPARENRENELGTTPRDDPAPLSSQPQNSPKDDNQLSAGPQKQLSLPDIAGSQPRSSVQFPQDESGATQPSQSKPASVIEDDEDLMFKGKHSIFTKLKAFAASPPFASHSRTTSGVTIGGQADSRHNGNISTPTSERGEFRFPHTLDEGSDVDADAEESGTEQRTHPPKKKNRRRRQPEEREPQTAPTTPKMTGRRSSFLANFDRPNFLQRRADTTDFSHQHREGVSEDEGREMLNREPAWRRRSTWLPSGQIGQQDAQPDQEERRPGNIRRLTGFTGPSDYAEGIAASWRRHRAERGSSLSAQRWRQIKAGLKLIGQRRKADTNTVDHAKSAELLAELASGVPAALILASMFQRDEHGSKRIPILLEQLKVKVTDSRIDSHSGDRHWVFKIELEYGSGLTRMKWVIHRTLRDFANLHLKYKLHFGTQKYIQMKSTEGGQHLPRLPKSVFPYLRGVRGLDSEAEDEEDEAAYDTTADATSGNERSPKKKKQHQHQSRRLIGGASRRKSAQEAEAPADASGAAGTAEGGVGSGLAQVVRRETYPEHQRKKLEGYLQRMIRFLIFKPDSNRLCRFLELSALGVRLAAEGSYHGKEGFLIIQSSKGLDFRRTLTPSLIKKRHSPKWFLVRHSYVVCVDSPEEMNIYDVFLVDPFFKIQARKVSLRNQNASELAKSAKESARHPKHHTLRLENSERKLRLLARNERQLHQFEDSIRFMVGNTPWSRPNRFGSFAPVRPNCFAQWLVDGRDHMWLVSRAINQAKDVIYIHDWWLSPELYMRRPAAISQKWRLDRLLQRKAREGVKIFVIMYRNINSAIPIDSEYSKFSLLDLHPNIFVQRSPNQFRQNTFFWAHHEKLCIVDHTLAFVGGIDLCFGRWDTPQHTLIDDKPTGFEMQGGPKDADHCQLWPGKDYSNPRIQDFYDLDKPYEEMYDRNVVPRMPWHDISMHVVGQPARDLTRHFVQRWNYILRQRKPTRPTPFLLPPPDFNAADLEALDLDGTCEIQLLRSSSMWSTGTPDIVEHSIMNAYVKLIEESEHFVYIENQFFVSTCEISGRRIENQIGDALVERIVRAAKNGECWRAVIIIPLMPGFQNTVDSEGGTSVRLIMQCQYRSICRGETSIFGRLRALGIEPEDYIEFYSLRAWGKIGPQKKLVTEQLYIHAKCMVVDDRAAIIGSANINERSMLGSRDSEVAAIVRDTDMIWSTMNHRPYLVGKFPHTLRMRLMREHLGIDVDELLEHNITTEQELRKIEVVEAGSRTRGRREEPDFEQKQDEREMMERRHRIQDEFISRSEDVRSFNHDIDWEQGNNPNLKTNKRLTADPRVTANPEHQKDVDGDGADRLKSATQAGLGDARDSLFLSPNEEVLVSAIASEGKGVLKEPKKAVERQNRRASEMKDLKQAPSSPTASGTQSNQNMNDMLSPCASSSPADPNPEMGLPVLSPKDNPDNFKHQRPSTRDLRHIFIDKDCMMDPVNGAFYLDTWHAVAEKNTNIFRSVFRCMPDNVVRSWKEYKEYAAYGERFDEMQSQHNAKASQASPTKQSGAPGAIPTVQGTKGQAPIASKSDPSMLDEKSGQQITESSRGENDQQPVSPTNGDTTPVDEKSASRGSDVLPSSDQRNERSNSTAVTGEGNEKQSSSPHLVDYSDALNLNATSQAWRRKRRAATHSSKRDFHASDEIMDKARAEELLNQVQGHLVMWPYDWLEKEEQGGNWLYALDQISPLEIYN